MKNIFILLILVFVGFVSCDGRKSRSESLKSSIEDFNEKQSDVVIVNYYPKDYTEIVTDTIISNEVNVYIRNYSLSNESLVMSVNNKAIPKIKKQHRVFVSDVVVTTSSKEILNTRISAEQFKLVSSDEFWDHATLQHVWLNQELSTTNDIKLEMSFINPRNNSYKLYRMSIDIDGQQKIDLIEEHI